MLFAFLSAYAAFFDVFSSEDCNSVIDAFARLLMMAVVFSLEVFIMSESSLMFVSVRSYMDLKMSVFFAIFSSGVPSLMISLASVVLLSKS